MDAVDLLPALERLQQLALTERISLLVLIRFMTLAARFRHDIALNQPVTAIFNDETAPMFLDDGTKTLLCNLLSLSVGAVDVLWTVTGPLVWTGKTLPEVLHDADMEDLIESIKMTDDDGPSVRCKCYALRSWYSFRHLY